MLNGLYVRLYLIIEYALGIVQYYDTCYWKYTKEEYSGRFRAECGSGTNTYRAEERKYIFTILKPKPTDKSFVCAMKLAKMQNERKVKSKTFRLQFYGKCTTVIDKNVTLEEKTSNHHHQTKKTKKNK